MKKDKKLKCVECKKEKAGKWFYGYPKYTNKVCMVCFDKPQKNNGSFSLDTLFAEGTELTLDPLNPISFYKTSRNSDESYD